MAIDDHIPVIRDCLKQQEFSLQYIPSNAKTILGRKYTCFLKTFGWKFPLLLLDSKSSDADTTFFQEEVIAGNLMVSPAFCNEGTELGFGDR